MNNGFLSTSQATWALYLWPRLHSNYQSCRGSEGKLTRYLAQECWAHASVAILKHRWSWLEGPKRSNVHLGRSEVLSVQSFPYRILFDQSWQNPELPLPRSTFLHSTILANLNHYLSFWAVLRALRAKQKNWRIKCNDAVVWAPTSNFRFAQQHHCFNTSQVTQNSAQWRSAVTSDGCVTAKPSGLLTHLSEHDFPEQPLDAKHAWLIMMINDDYWDVNDDQLLSIVHNDG